MHVIIQSVCSLQTPTGHRWLLTGRIGCQEVQPEEVSQRVGEVPDPVRGCTQGPHNQVSEVSHLLLVCCALNALYALDALYALYALDALYALTIHMNICASTQFSQIHSFM